jgi:putative SOS response-associated peptidase YedK
MAQAIGDRRARTKLLRELKRMIRALRAATVHDRMPLIVQPKDYARWLDSENADIADILAPYPPGQIIAYPVSRRVNDPKNDDESLVEPKAE